MEQTCTDWWSSGAPLSELSLAFHLPAGRLRSCNPAHDVCNRTQIIEAIST